MSPETTYQRIADAVFSAPWAITPEKHEVICALIQDKVMGAAIAKTDFVLSESSPTLTADGVQVIPIRGTISKRMNLLSAFSGGASTELVGASVKEALDNSDVKAIVLDMDTNGGTVDGTDALGDLIFNARGKKPIVTFADGSLFSAGVWIGSAADKIVLPVTGGVGSIGVLTSHIDRSGADAKKGFVRTTISAGSQKAIGNSNAPLSDSARSIIQSQIDFIYSIFIGKVARNRGVSKKAALAMADGKVFLGQQALDIGLVDQIGERADAIALASSLVNNESRFFQFDPLAASRVGDSGGVDTFDPFGKKSGKGEMLK